MTCRGQGSTRRPNPLAVHEDLVTRDLDQYLGVRQADTRSLWLDETSYLVGVCDTVYVSPMQASPRVIDVYVDDSIWHRVRW